MVPSQDTGSSLRAIEDAKRMRLAHVWLKLDEEARSQSNVLQEMEAVPVQQQVYLVWTELLNCASASLGLAIMVFLLSIQWIKSRPMCETVGSATLCYGGNCCCLRCLDSSLAIGRKQKLGSGT